MAETESEGPDETRLDSACVAEFVRLIERRKFESAKEYLENEKLALRIARYLFVDLGHVLGKLIVDQLAYEGWCEKAAIPPGTEPKKGPPEARKRF